MMYESDLPLIPETRGHFVRFGGDTDPYVAPVIAWNAKGKPMIAARYELVEAEEFAERLGVGADWAIRRDEFDS